MKAPKRLTFPGAEGNLLAARLDQPAGPPLAHAIFAHCFACSKESLAAARVSAALAAHGVAVLRVDFTGLGASEGAFGDAGFSSNVGDIIAAAGFLEAEFAAPTLLVGHSLGGAAALAAAEQLSAIRAVATIGAPSNPARTLRHVGEGREAALKTGSATVHLGGRDHSISRAFIEDFEREDLLARVARLRAAVLVMHSPVDETVGIDNASAIFRALKHPKSFVTLDRADHLLTRREDAAYAADVIAAWMRRYLDLSRDAPAKSTSAPEDRVVSAGETGEGGFQLAVSVGPHGFLADEPIDVGGQDTGPSPYELLGASLAACTSMTVRMYANLKSIPLERVETRVEHLGKHAVDTRESAEGRPPRLDHFSRVVTLTGDLSDDDRERLLKIAEKCPVHRTLEASARIVTRLD
ncbi:alpha/beta fold hydrolase [bacterium]|nr:alpha/beta fold hydrolase [bacterium]